MTQTLIRRDIPVLLITVVATEALIAYFTPFKEIKSINDTMMNFGTLMSTMMLNIGSIILIMSQLTFLRRAKKTDVTLYYTIMALCLTFITTYAGLWNQPLYSWLTMNVQQPASMGFGTITGCAIVLAAYKSFRLRSLDAAALLFGGVITMLTNAPIGEAISPAIPVLGKWLLDPVTRAAERGMIVGLGLGAVYLGIRAYLGRETKALGID